MRSILLAVAAAVLVGCGSPTAASFGPDYEEAFAPANEAVEQLDAAWDDPTAAREAARRFDEAAGRLRELEAPSGAEDELDAVASAVAKLADNFASAAEHYPAEDWVLDAVEVNAERLLDANQALQVAIESLSVAVALCGQRRDAPAAGRPEPLGRAWRSPSRVAGPCPCGSWSTERCSGLEMTRELDA